MSVIEREIERVMLDAMWERAKANAVERTDAPDVTEMAKRVAALVEAHYAGAVEALRWYADPGNYDAIGPHGTVKGPAWRVADDGGQRARDALGGQ